MLSSHVTYESWRAREKKSGAPSDCEHPQKEGWIPTHAGGVPAKRAEIAENTGVSVPWMRKECVRA